MHCSIGHGELQKNPTATGPRSWWSLAKARVEKFVWSAGADACTGGSCAQSYVPVAELKMQARVRPLLLSGGADAALMAHLDGVIHVLLGNFI